MLIDCYKQNAIQRGYTSLNGFEIKCELKKYEKHTQNDVFLTEFKKLMLSTCDNLQGGAVLHMIILGNPHLLLQT